MNHNREYWLSTLLASLGIHSLFCAQAITVAAQGGMVRDAFLMVLFFPHVMLMFFLPPSDPISYNGVLVQVDWLRFAGKLVVAYPASLLYGLAFGAIWCFIRRRKSA
jgi:hypothetical protein